MIKSLSGGKMGKILSLELKKIITKKRLLIMWVAVLFLVYQVTGGVTVSDNYSSIFQKIYLMAPLIGILMFMVFSESYIMEYRFNIDSVIKTTKSYKKVVLAKSIANTIIASLISISILLTMTIKALILVDFEGINIPIKEIWYFGNSGSNITILGMVMIMCLTFILGSFLFAQIGLFLSSTSKSAVKPFLLGGLIMGVPFLGNIYGISQIFSKKMLLFTPLYGMFSAQLIRYGAPISADVFFIVVSLAFGILFYRLTLMSFTKSRN